MVNIQCRNIASRTNGAGCIYTEYARTKHTYIYIYRQFSVFTTSVGLAALAPIICGKISKLCQIICLLQQCTSRSVHQSIRYSLPMISTHLRLSFFHQRFFFILLAVSCNIAIQYKIRNLLGFNTSLFPCNSKVTFLVGILVHPILHAAIKSNG